MEGRNASPNVTILQANQHNKQLGNDYKLRN